MIVDTSAVVAIVRGEPDAMAYSDALAGASVATMSAATYLETAIVVDSAGDPVASRVLDRLVASAQIVLADVTAYALATVTDRPLLYKGNDFGHTDNKGDQVKVVSFDAGPNQVKALREGTVQALVAQQLPRSRPVSRS